MTRLSRCDACHRPKSCCEWVTRSDSGHRYFVCPDCKDYWERLGKLMANARRCDYCKGTGDVMTRGLPGDEWPEACPKCNGTGKVPPSVDAGDPVRVRAK